jgi:hypothetical protein
MFWLQLKFTMFESIESQIYHQNLLFIRLLISSELFPLPIYTLNFEEEIVSYGFDSSRLT